MDDFKINSMRQEGDEVYFILYRRDGVFGKIQLNIKMIIEFDFIDDIVWDDEV